MGFGKAIAKFNKSGVGRVGRTIKKGAKATQTIFGKIDKLTGGAASKALAAHPYGVAGQAALNTAAA